MKVAMPVWNGRISPVLDVARHVVLLDVEGEQVLDRQEITLAGNGPVQRARTLAQQGIAVLICGAVSQALEGLLTASGICVMSNMCGLADKVLDAFIQGRLEGPAFRMPGCCGRRQRYRGRHGRPW